MAQLDAKSQQQLFKGDLEFWPTLREMQLILHFYWQASTTS